MTRLLTSRIGAVLVALTLAPEGMAGAQALATNPQLPPIGCRRITQADIDANRPYTITQPGRYCLTQNIQVPYTTDRNTTIAVKASNVTLLFLGYSLTQLIGDDWSYTTAISVKGALRNVVISGGTIRDFGIGVEASGGWVLRLNNLTGRVEYVAQPLLRLQVTDMSLTGLQIGVNLLADVQASTIERNRFDNSLLGVGLGGNLAETEVRNNAFTFGTGRWFASGGGWQMGIWGGGPYAAVIRENTFTGNPRLTSAQLQQIGMHLNNGSATQPLKGHNLIEGNLFLRLNTPISLDGSQRAPNNVIRSNRIYGQSPTALYMGPLTTAYTAISVGNNENVTIEANVIHSGADVGYHHGIYLWGNTTVSTQASGLPAVFNNETCNVDVDLDPVSVDGGNFWNTCSTSVPQ